MGGNSYLFLGLWIISLSFIHALKFKLPEAGNIHLAVFFESAIDDINKILEKIMGKLLGVLCFLSNRLNKFSKCNFFTHRLYPLVLSLLLVPYWD